MKSKLLGLALTLILITAILIVPEQANAAATSCYGSLDGAPPAPGFYIACVLANIWLTAQWIFVVLAIIFTSLLIYKTITNRENSKVLETIPSQWMYLFIFFFLAFGAGGILLNFAFKFLGFGGLDTWIAPIETLLTGWDALIPAGVLDAPPIP